jgi:succinate-semialdehyde dehydrogenase/glutarate-semialdehyde dehydrogenase
MGMSVDPATGETIRRYATHSDAEIDALLERACRGTASWAELDFPARAARLRLVAARLRADTRTLAELMGDEMGKPLAQGEAEVEKCAWVCEHYAEHAAEFLASVNVATEAPLSRVVFRPLGAVFAVMPWNFPLWQAVRCAAPTLMAGNGVVLRHASNVTGCALAIEELFKAADAPLELAIVAKEQVPKIIDDVRIAAVTLTGSVAAGSAVAAAAGKAVKKSVLELGGSDPYVVLADADVDAAVETCAASRLINSGQSCIAAKRFIVEEPVHARFVEQLIETLRHKHEKHPREEGADLGPLAQASTREKLHAQVERSVAAGARCALGGALPAARGYFYPPTVLTGVGPGMPVFDEETFGPVAAVVCAENETDALRLANAGCYGLGAALFTRDAERGVKLAETALVAGNCFVNDFVRSDPRLPFGGVRRSGYGRELGMLGIKEFVNAKTIVVGGVSAGGR